MDTTLGGEFSCALSVRNDCHEEASEMACSGTPQSNDGACRLTFEVQVGQNYYVIADTGSQAEVGGLYHLGVYPV